MALPPRKYLITGGTVLFFVCAALLWHTGIDAQERQELGYRAAWSKQICGTKMPTMDPHALVAQATGPQIRTNIAVASAFGAHFDVYMALAWTLQRVLERGTGIIRVFSAERPFDHGFQKIVDELQLYRDAVRSWDDLFVELPKGEIDLLILGTCEVDIGFHHDRLLAAWDARPTDNKFKLVCISHNFKTTDWQDKIPDWSRRNALRLLPISEHVADRFRKSFDELSDSLDPKMWSAGLETVKTDYHVPILDLKHLPSRSPKRVLSRAVIQGSFDGSRRDYTHVFEDLITSLNDDPQAWGYSPRTSDSGPFEAPKGEKDPFKLFIVGRGSLDIPVELRNIVSLHTQLPYDEYYKLMMSMDICVPAFAAANAYHVDQASSTVTMTVEVNVPMLVTRRMLRAYTYMDDDRAVVTRPSALREIAALKVLRTGDATSFLDSDPTGAGRKMGDNESLKKDVNAMLARGWRRQPSEFRAFKEKVWRDNEAVVKRILRDE